MNISDLIGLTISEIRYTYTNRNEYDIQEFFAYLKLSNGLIIEIPQYSDLDLDESVERNRIFEDAKIPSKKCKNRIESQRIIDIHFCYYNNEQDFDSKAYIELENETYLTEQNRGPQGLTDIDLEILNKSEFEKRIAELDEDSEIKSYRTAIKNIC
ncbi:MAG: hypothetical protein ABJL44_14410 [Algibacter sp.]